MRRKPLALTLGDPAGIGPEIVVGAWEALRDSGPAFMLIGDHDTVAAALGRRGETRRVTSPDEALAAFPDTLPVLDQPLTQAVVAGKASPAYAQAVIGWIETAVGLALTEAVCAVVTAPIAKAPLYEAGFSFAGHTEFLAELTAGAPYAGVRGPVMMLAAPGLRTVLTTVHEPLAAVPGKLTVEGIVRTAGVLFEALTRDFGIERPRIAMAALNPHAGESGKLGREEVEIIGPAVERLRAAGVDCSPVRPADTLFHAEARAGYDGVICHYHDQALIPLKTIDFWGGVNITLGLPIVRTSPDHGVGFDIAGRGVARPDSLIAALHAAADIATRRSAP